MSNPLPGSSGGPDPSAEHAAPQQPAGESSRRQASADQAAGRFEHPEAQLGGADAVEKTTYVVGEGTEPGARPRGDYVARDASGGSSLGVWIVGGIAALIALVYAIGIFR
ncbi:MAG TPA: hypothetical protein VG106_08495 [Vicinamibacterales bacterium]|nr:hypothetical protein [Vicinamibacterales bacterium]